MTTPADTTFLEKVNEHMITGITLDLTRYLVAATLMTVLLFVFKRWADNRRIQTKRAKRSDYLREFLSDPRVIDINPVGRFLLLNLIILPFRPKKSAEAYQQVWDEQRGSPLLRGIQTGGDRHENRDRAYRINHYPKGYELLEHFPAATTPLPSR